MIRHKKDRIYFATNEHEQSRIMQAKEGKKARKFTLTVLRKLSVQDALTNPFSKYTKAY